MNRKFVKTRQFVSDNRTLLAFYAGCLATSGVTYLVLKDRTMLELTKEHAELLKLGGSVRYELKDQTLHLVNIAAVEATQAAL